jgi:hypothetical protein
MLLVLLLSVGNKIHGLPFPFFTETEDISNPQQPTSQDMPSKLDVKTSALEDTDSAVTKKKPSSFDPCSINMTIKYDVEKLEKYGAAPCIIIGDF